MKGGLSDLLCPVSLLRCESSRKYDGLLPFLLSEHLVGWAWPSAKLVALPREEGRVGRPLSGDIRSLLAEQRCEADSCFNGLMGFV